VTQTTPKIIEDITRLVGAWCDRRALDALRAILQAWPLTSGLTDDWGNLRTALERVRALARADLTEEERRMVDDLIHEVQTVIDRR
jgi:hypothetical protein